MISGCGSNTENASLYVDHHTKHIPKLLDSFIEDTPHMLRLLEEKNSQSSQDSSDILVSIDVVGLYPNIPQTEGMKAFYEKINDSAFRDQSTPSYFLMLLLQCVLQFNVFVFNGLHYLQEWGTAIGTRVAPTYANIFMGYLEEKLLREWKGTAVEMWRRYIDDVITIWKGSEEELIEFLTFINMYHSTIKFTAEYRTRVHRVTVKWIEGTGLQVNRSDLGEHRPRSIDFLDTTIWINEDGKFETDLFVKSTDRVTYLKPSSCHPGHISKNIPYSLGYRLKRVCSAEQRYKLRLNELRFNLKTRGYSYDILDKAFSRLDSIKREDALKKVVRKKANQRTVFAVTYDPRLPSVSQVLRKHFEIAKEDPNFDSTFVEMPLIGYRRSKNLGEYLTRAKLYPETRFQLRNKIGFQRCSRIGGVGCQMCHHSKSTTTHHSAATGEQFKIKGSVKCTDTFIVYSIQCNKCPKAQYIGQSTQMAAKRFTAHYSDIITKKCHKTVSKHFNLPGHSASNMVFLPFEKLRVKDSTLLTVREDFWIKKKETLKSGLNIR